MPLILKIYSDSTQARLTSAQSRVGQVDQVRAPPERERRRKSGLGRNIALPIACPTDRLLPSDLSR